MADVMADRLASLSVEFPPAFPDRTQLPESDGTFVFAQRLPWSQNFEEHPQSL